MGVSPPRIRQVLWAHRHPILTWAGLLSLGVVPWVVIQTSGTTLLFPWGTIVAETGQLTLLSTFLSQPGPLPMYMQYWPLAALCYALALGWAGASSLGLEADQRVTAGLVVLVAFATFVMANGFGVEPNRRAIPLGTIHALLVAAWLWLAPLE